MNLPKGCNYFAYDIYTPEMELLNTFARKNFPNINFQAKVRDIFETDERSYDVVLLLKIFPVLERQRKGSTADVLKRIDTKYFVVSFQLKSLSGKEVGMCIFYTENFETILGELSYSFEKIVFENEIV
jgi:16S rRNA (guanine(1405)-N(7))-methyltransferase